MVTLDTNFSDGDFLTAGAITSTSSVNGITTTINSNTITKLKYGGSDLTLGSIASSTTETTIASVTIPANTIATGALYSATISVQAQGSSANDSIFKLKSGVASSEVERYAVTVNCTPDEIKHATIVWYDEAPTWSGDVSVIITGKNNNNHANSKSTVFTLVVIGF